MYYLKYIYVYHLELANEHNEWIIMIMIYWDIAKHYEQNGCGIRFNQQHW